jgi:anthranilate phosphoribosyltransferase
MTSTPEHPDSDPTALMHSIIKRIATGPELSKDLSRDEARRGMRAILDGEVHPVQAAIFLIALRMKRETDDENLGVLDALREASTIVTAPVDDLIDVADPYDGYTRSLPSSPFLPAVLAACGVPAVSHGVETLGPKYGVTHRQVLRAAGAPVDLSPQEAAARIADRQIGWAYLDQRAFCPSLHALVGLRTLMVKRPVLTTVETLVGPVRGRRQTHLVTGYVHKAYPRVYAMLARAAGFDSAVFVRGVEGGVVPSLREPGKMFYYHDRGEEQSVELNPTDAGLTQTVRAIPLPPELVTESSPGEEPREDFDRAVAARKTAELGLEALSGTRGAMRDALIYSASICLWHLGRADRLRNAAQSVGTILDKGAALARITA